ncbi:MAG: ribonuclease III [Bdellovibrionales bacterium]|nr:ribonuclease III [Bdellovibrionales bacterium]
MLEPSPIDDSYLSFIQDLESKINYRFVDRNLLQTALSHKSFANEFTRRFKKKFTNNERLEFLGDAVLDLAMSESLMKTFPTDSEGALSKKRASLVNEEILAKIAFSLELERCLLLGRGEKATGGQNKPRLLACAVEALIGAIFKDSNYESVKAVIDVLFKDYISGLNPLLDYEKDFKTRLQELCQHQVMTLPQYEITHEIGPAHATHFTSEVYLNGKWLSRGSGVSKKSAEQDAAKNALEILL